MTITMPRVVQTPSPNYTASPIAHDLIVMHVMEGGYAGSVAWLCQKASQASVHLCMNEEGSEVSQLVPLQFKAWGQVQFNGKGISIEMPGFTAQGIPDARWRAGAKIAAWLCRAYSIPPVWAKGGQGRGVCQHVDLGAAGGGHHDCAPVGGDVWMKFMGYVKDAYDAFGDGPLPSFALHGTPGMHEIALPPSVPPEPSHGGAARIDPPAAVTQAKSAALVMQAAVKSFQAASGVTVDGIVGTVTNTAYTKALAS